MHRKPLQVLLHLLQHADEVVTKDELAEACWPGRILSDTVLSTTIKRLRAVLGDDGQQIIKTVHGFGYRFVAPVSVELLAAEAPPRLALAPGDHPPLRPTWSLVERIGGGGSGEVWRVCQDRTGEQRVFKFAVDGAALRGLKREVTLYRVLHDSLGDHAHLLKVLDWNLERAPFFIETEYEALGSLLQWSQAQGGLLEVPRVQRLKMIAQCAELLASAHRVGVLHKDLKPSNVLVSGQAPDWQIRLGDFGSGGMLDAQRLHALGITRLGFTQTVAAFDTSGTPLYLAPEVLSGQPSTLQSDIYALGVMLYQAVVGDWSRPLAPGWERQVDDETLREDIAAAVDGDPARRLADAGELARRLRRLDERRNEREARKHAAAEQEEFQRRLERAELRRRWALALAAVLVLGIAAVLALYVQLLGSQQQRLAALGKARDEADISHQVTDYVVSLFDAASPEKSGGRLLEPRKLVDLGQSQIESRFRDRPQLRARMLGTVGALYCSLGVPDRCQADLEQALALQKGDPEADPLQTAELLGKLGRAYAGEARWADDERMQRQALAIYEARLNDTHDPRIAERLAALGDALQSEQKTTESIEVLERARKLARGADGKDRLESADVLGLLAQSYVLAGRTDDAIALAAQRSALVRTQVGADDLRYYDAQSDQAIVLMDAERYAEAEPIERAVLDGYLKVYSADSRQVLDVEGNLAVILDGENKDAESLKWMRAIVDASRRLGRTGDSEYATELVNLGELEETWGDYPSALEHLRGAYEIARRHDREDSVQVLTMRVSLARVLTRMGRAREALPLLQPELAGNLNGQIADLERGRRLLELAACYRDLGRPQLAAQTYDAAETHFRKTMPEFAMAKIAVLSGRARLALHEHRYGQALVMLQQLVDTDHAGEKSVSPGTLYDEVGEAQALLGLKRREEAVKLLAGIRGDVERELAPIHPARLALERILGTSAGTLRHG
nr:tetratricopeptide repeat protein [Solimonas terrae]